MGKIKKLRDSAPVSTVIVELHGIHLEMVQIPRTATTSRKFAAVGGAGARLMEIPAGIARDATYRVTFTRHPLDRFASAYQMKSNAWRPHGVERTLDRMLSMDPLEVNKHLRPQHLFDLSDIDYFGKFETLLEDWETLQGVFPELLDLGHENGTKNRLGWQDLLPSKRIRAKAKRFYEKDFKEFGYS